MSGEDTVIVIPWIEVSTPLEVLGYAYRPKRKGANNQLLDHQVAPEYPVFTCRPASHIK